MFQSTSTRSGLAELPQAVQALPAVAGLAHLEGDGPEDGLEDASHDSRVVYHPGTHPRLLFVEG
jgi:hypothetical protein